MTRPLDAAAGTRHPRRVVRARAAPSTGATAPRTTGRRSCCPAVEAPPRVGALRVLPRTPTTSSTTSATNRSRRRREGADRLGDRFFADLAAGSLRRPGAPGRGAHRAGLRPRSRGASAASSPRWRWTWRSTGTRPGTTCSSYMDGSAAVIGEMMLPILEPRVPAARLGPARDLGFAFQLTNFLRDVGEDLDRGRVYLPQEDLAALRRRPARRRVVDAAWRAADALRDRPVPRPCTGRPTMGIALLPPASARCVRAALVLYSGILDRIEAADYDVFTQRVRVPTWREGRGRRPGRARSPGLSRAARGPRRPRPRGGQCCCSPASPTPRRCTGRRGDARLRRVSVVVPARDEERRLPGPARVAARPSIRPRTRSSWSTTARPTRTAAVARRRTGPRCHDQPAAAAGRASRGPATSAPRPPPARTCCSSTPTRGWRPTALGALVAEHAPAGRAACRCSPTTAPSGAYEQLSAFFNVVAMMGTGAFAVGRPGARRHGLRAVPADLERPTTWPRVATPRCAAEVVEDVHLARRYRAARAAGGAASAAATPSASACTPAALRQLVRGMDEEHRRRAPAGRPRGRCSGRWPGSAPAWPSPSPASGGAAAWAVADRARPRGGPARRGLVVALQLRWLLRPHRHVAVVDRGAVPRARSSPSWPCSSGRWRSRCVRRRRDVAGRPLPVGARSGR